MSKVVVGFFRTHAEGEQARGRLISAGFSENQISYLAGDTRGHVTPKVGPPLKDAGTESEAGTDAFIGGAVGLAAGIIALSIPGVGLLLAAGPIAGAIGGLTAGTAVGGVIGLLKDHGVSDEEVDFYAEGVGRGGALITLHALDEQREGKARKILDDAGAIDVKELADEWRRTGWAGPGKRTLRAG